MRSDPFLIEGPALISFSGGRTSAYMLRCILDSGLQPDCHVVFADTGKERAETYEFVREVERRWLIKVNWVHRPGYFDQLLIDKQALPNGFMRFCTSELKLEPIWAFGRSQGYDHWESIIGIRADEPRRAAKIKGRLAMDFEEVRLPLVTAGVTESDVLSFWGRQPFNLRLHPWESNCDLCFLKGQTIRRRIMQDHPELAAWWIEQERRTGRSFVKATRPDYQRLFDQSQLPMLFDPSELESGFDCICGE